MTLLQIQMLLHYYAIATPYAQNDPAHRQSPAVHEQRLALFDAGLLTHEDSERGWRTTNKGRRCVEALKNVAGIFLTNP